MIYWSPHVVMHISHHAQYALYLHRVKHSHMLLELSYVSLGNMYSLGKGKQAYVRVHRAPQWTESLQRPGWRQKSRDMSARLGCQRVVLEHRRTTQTLKSTFCNRVLRYYPAIELCIVASGCGTKAGLTRRDSYRSI